MTRRRGLPFSVDRDRYWAVMLPLFSGGARMRHAMASVRRRFVEAFSLVDRQALEEVAARVERLEGRIARLAQGRR